MRAIAKIIGFVLLATPIMFLMAASVGLAAIGAARYAAGLTESGTIPAWLPYIYRSVEGHDVGSWFGIGRPPVAPSTVFRLPDARRRGTCRVAHGTAQLPNLLAAAN